jgi:Na+-translocating ferredoxin:NAD+ oxidoreductase RnfE subunit
MRRRDWIGPGLCVLGAACMLAALAVDLDSTAAKALMLAAAILFVPGAFVTLALVRHVAGPPN